MCDGPFGFDFLREQNVPAAGSGPNLGGDDGSFPAVPDLRVADEQVGDLHGGDDLAVMAGAFGFVMVTRRLNHDVGEIVILEIESAEFCVLDA